MLPKVDVADPTPKYLQTQRILTEAIRAGQLRAGSKLPSTKDIGTLLNVSLITAHKALERLVEAGMLRREVGRGTYVCDNVREAIEAERHVSIGLVLDPEVNINDYYHSAILDGLRRAARVDEEHAEFFFHDRFRLRQALRKQTDGMICIHPAVQRRRDVEQLAELLPVVVLGGALHGGRVPCIDSDNFGGARETVRHLAKLGHRRLMLLSGPLDLSNSRDRVAGTRAEIAAHRLQLSARDTLISTDCLGLDGQCANVLRRRVRESSRPTAIVAGGFYLALAAMQIIRQAGLSIPADISIVSFDDPASAPLLAPPLTTVRQPLHQMADSAYRALRRRMLDGSSVNPSRTFKTELILRQSTGPAPRL